MVVENITWDWVGFVVLGLATIVFGLMVVLARRLVHATLWLAGVLLGVAGWFLYFGSEFLAGIQVIVYVGAILTLILFAVMWTSQEEETGEDTPPGEGHT